MTEDRLAALTVLVVPVPVRAELLADAAHRGTVRLVGEAIDLARADADALWASLQSDVPTPAAIGAMADQIARVAALGQVAARLTSAASSGVPVTPVEHFPESPFGPSTPPAAPTPVAAARWSADLTAFVATVTNLPAPPTATRSRYQAAVHAYERQLAGFGDQSKKLPIPQSTDADLIADDAARAYHDRAAEDRATLTHLAAAATQVRTGAVDPLDLLATADYITAVRLPESRAALENLTALIADADASRSARGLDSSR